MQGTIPISIAGANISMESQNLAERLMHRNADTLQERVRQGGKYWNGSTLCQPIILVPKKLAGKKEMPGA